MIQFAHGVGIALLWMIGMFVIPMATSIVAIFLGKDVGEASIVFWVTFIFYLIATGVILVTL